MIPGRASVVRDRHGMTFIVGVSDSARAAVHGIDGATHDRTIDRYMVPVGREGELRAALAGLAIAWVEDHRAEQTRQRPRCEVCWGPLATVLVAQSQTRHGVCKPARPAPPSADYEQVSLL